MSEVSIQRVEEANKNGDLFLKIAFLGRLVDIGGDRWKNGFGVETSPTVLTLLIEQSMTKWVRLCANNDINRMVRVRLMVLKFVLLGAYTMSVKAC